MKRILLPTLIFLTCILASCSMAGNNPGNTDNPAIDQPVDSPEPEKPVVQTPLSKPYISFIDFIDPGTSSAAIIMTTSEQNAEIWYTTDGTTPSEDNGIEYNWSKRTVICGSTVITAVPVSAGCTIKAVTFKDGRYSDVVSFLVPSEPTLDPPLIFVRGEDRGLVVISMQTNDSSATIYFTRDGSIPTMESMIYSQHVTQHILPGNKVVTGMTISHGSTVKAFAYSTRYELTSDIATIYIE